MGKGIAQMIDGNKDKRNIEITSILVRNKNKYESSKYANIEDVFEGNIDILVELRRGIPVLKFLTESLEGNSIESMYAILNVTTNFILSKMYNEGLSYDEVLKEAQELGFVEANPEADVEGYDGARKLSILSNLAYNRRVY